MRKVLTVGVIADTHGLLRPEVVAAFRGVDAIVHAGDIGSPEILRSLSALAPVTAVRGNNDREPWARILPETAVLEIGGVRLYVLHDVKELDRNPRAGRAAAVLCGHSHRPHAEEREGVLFFNPGSAGPRRFRLPVSVGRLTIAGGRVSAEILPLMAGLESGGRSFAAGDGGGARACDRVDHNSDRVPEGPRGGVRRGAGVAKGG
jgi:hypothetical protein